MLCSQNPGGMYKAILRRLREGRAVAILMPNSWSSVEFAEQNKGRFVVLQIIYPKGAK